MPYTVEWLVPHQVIDVRLEKIFTLEDLADYDIKVCAMLDTCQPKSVHFLIDVGVVQQFPSLLHIKPLKVLNHTSSAWLVVYGNKNVLITAISTLISAMFGSHVYWSNTREEGLAFLRRTDNTLIELK
jgi:hypothetical protein